MENEQILLNRGLGNFGHDLITDIEEHTGNRQAVVPQGGDVVVTTLTFENSTGSWDGKTIYSSELPPMGHITAIKRASGGNLIAYKRG